MLVIFRRSALGSTEDSLISRKQMLGELKIMRSRLEQGSLLPPFFKSLNAREQLQDTRRRDKEHRSKSRFLAWAGGRHETGDAGLDVRDCLWMSSSRPRSHVQ